MYIYIYCNLHVMPVVATLTLTPCQAKYASKGASVKEGLHDCSRPGRTV